MSFSQIPWFFLCGGLTAVGLIGSWFALRRRGPRAAARWLAWALLPIALYLVGILQVLWRFGVAIGDFFSGLAFSPKVWSGVILAGISLVLFVVTGGLRGRSRRKRAKAEPDSQPPATRALGAAPPAAASAGMASRPKAAPVPAKRKGAAPDDEDFGEVAAILKRHGIS
ncbi:MAG TPA: cellulose synthase [Streptosporangiaceae bacterium]|jgi:hypothetical protein